MKGGFALKEHMILTHFYHWNNFALGEGSSLHLDWNIIKSTRLEQNLFNPRKWKLVINVASAVWSFLSLAPMISKPLWPQRSFPIGQDVPFQSGATGGSLPGSQMCGAGVRNCSLQAKSSPLPVFLSRPQVNRGFSHFHVVKKNQNNISWWNSKFQYPSINFYWGSHAHDFTYYL